MKKTHVLTALFILSLVPSAYGMGRPHEDLLKKIPSSTKNMIQEYEKYHVIRAYAPSQNVYRTLDNRLQATLNPQGNRFFLSLMSDHYDVSQLGRVFLAGHQQKYLIQIVCGRVIAFGTVASLEDMPRKFSNVPGSRTIFQIVNVSPGPGGLICNAILNRMQPLF